jgi:hypothetical protein
MSEQRWIENKNDKIMKKETPSDFPSQYLQELSKMEWFQIPTREYTEENKFFAAKEVKEEQDHSEQGKLIYSYNGSLCF